MAVTIYLRYVLNTAKLKEFEHYGKLWIPLVEKFGGGMIEQDQRDINLLTPYVKFSYQASPGYKFLGEFSTYFQRGPIVDPVSHDGRGYEARAGVEFARR